MQLQPLPPNAFTISHSSQSLYRSCPRKFEFRKFYQNNLRDEGLAAGVGQCLHRAWQHWLLHQDEDAALVELMMTYPMQLFMQDNDNNRSIEAAYATFQSMVNSVHLGEYEVAKIRCLDGETRPAVEVPFAIELAGFSLNGEFLSDGTAAIPVYYIGYVDAFLFSMSAGLYKTTDVKTHRDNSNDLSGKYMFSDQCVPYGLVLEHILGHAITNFEVLYVSSYVDLMQPETQVYPFMKSTEYVNDWYAGLMVDLHNISNFYRTNWFPRHGGDTCKAWRRDCQYLQICHSRERELLQSFLLGGEDQPNRVEPPFVPWINFKLAA